MLTSHFHTLSIRIAPFHLREPIETLLVTSNAVVLPSRSGAASARAPPLPFDDLQPRNAHSPGRGETCS